MFAFTVVTHSVSAVLLATLRDGPRRRGDIDLLCGSERMVQKRKAHMLEMGLLEGGASGYRPTEKGRRLLNAFDRLHQFFFPPLRAK